MGLKFNKKMVVISPSGLVMIVAKSTSYPAVLSGSMQGSELGRTADGSLLPAACIAFSDTKNTSQHFQLSYGSTALCPITNICSVLNNGI